MSAFTLRPGTLIGLSPDQLAKELDTHLPRLYDAHNTLRGIAVQGPALNAGFALVSGIATFTGSQTLINTGLAQVKQLTATLQSSAPSAITITTLIGPTNLSQISLFAWQPTSSSVTTPIACTTATTVHWTASGINSLNVLPIS